MRTADFVGRGAFLASWRRGGSFSRDEGARGASTHPGGRAAMLLTRTGARMTATAGGESISSEGLLRAYAERGDARALEALIARLWPEAVRVAQRALGDPAAADD